MKILVVAATELELKCVEDLQTPKEIELKYGLHGVGQLATAYHVLQHIEEKQPDIIVQVGIAGCFSSDALIGEALAVETEYLGDLGVQEHGVFHSVFDLKLMDENQFPFTQKKLQNPHTQLLEKSGLRRVTAITVNEITTSKERMINYINAYHPFFESMEGAAFHYCCLMKKIPFLQIRAASNYIGERDKSKWKIEQSLHSIKNGLSVFLKNI